jgi:exodeoxyribonuclease V gamma subunit
VVDERNFCAGALHRPGPFSFDRLSLRAAAAGRGPRATGSPFLSQRLPVEPRPDEVEVDDLVALLEHPAKWFLRRRLGLSLAGEAADADDRVPLELGPLDAWQVGDRLLAACLAGVDRQRAVAAEWRRGQVPPKELGRAVLRDVADRVGPIADAAASVASGPARVVDVRADLRSGTRVTGTVGGVHGDVVVRTVYSRLAPKHRLRAWVQLLALVASEPERAWQAVTVGRPQGSRPGAVAAQLRTPDPAWALQRLDELVQLRERAMREPLPLPVETGFAYASSRFAGNEEVQALESARQQWRSGFERGDDHHGLCWGSDCDLDELLGSPDAVEQAWWPHDSSRFGVLARRVWQPLLDHETTVVV